MDKEAIKTGDEYVIRFWEKGFNIGGGSGVRDIRPLGEALRDGARGDRVAVVKVIRVGRLDLSIFDETPAGDDEVAADA